jgi:hypothetical protein
VIDPPLRPIISNIGSPTYNVAKSLNATLQKYLPKEFMVESTHEFINIIKSVNNAPMIASLDVESLFTNIPVKETIEIILENVYNNKFISPPFIPKNVMRQLLMICTTENPFQDLNGDTYIQIDGVSMGSPLGPLFANFYMSNLENKVLPKWAEKPTVYCRYIDDIFLVINDLNHILKLKEKFEKESCLRFTYEIEKENNLHFLDVQLNRNENNIETSVY